MELSLQDQDRLRDFAEHLGIPLDEAKRHLGELWIPIVCSSAVGKKMREARPGDRKLLKSSSAEVPTVTYFRYIVLLEEVQETEKFKSFWSEWNKLTYSRRKEVLQPALEWSVSVLRPSLDNPDFALLSDLSENKLDLFSVSDPVKFIEEPLEVFLRRRKKMGADHLAYYLSRILVEYLFSEQVLAARDRLKAYVEESTTPDP